MSDDSVADAIAAMARAKQAETDRNRKIFERIIRTARADPEDLHKTLCINLTLKPPYKPLMLALTWMQADPAEWAGFHPEVCENVARMFHIGEDV